MQDAITSCFLQTTQNGVLLQWYQSIEWCALCCEPCIHVLPWYQSVSQLGGMDNTSMRILDDADWRLIEELRFVITSSMTKIAYSGSHSNAKKI